MGYSTTYKDDEFQWNNQGQLTYILNQEMDEIEYHYDTCGFRRKKTVNGVETRFVTDGAKILAMKQGTNTLTFRYVLNKLVGFLYNTIGSSKEYLYQRNIQGDIVGIFDDDGKEIGGYAYDAYGNHVIIKDEDGIATLNPFRYRGYFYDEETGLYYLNARYYDPEVGRFISTDDISYLDPESINGLNLYAYCSNNPIMLCDPSGNFAITRFLLTLAVGWAVTTIASNLFGAQNFFYSRWNTDYWCRGLAIGFWTYRMGIRGNCYSFWYIKYCVWNS